MKEPVNTGAEQNGDPRRGGRRRLRMAAVLAVALVAGFLAWVIVSDDDGEVLGVDVPLVDESGTQPGRGAVPATVAQLRSLASSSDHPVYWAGPRAGFTYELTETTDGRIYIRYLPAGVAVGAPEPDYLTIGTYPLDDAFGATTAAGQQPGVSTVDVAGGGIVIVSQNRPSSVYLAYPDGKVQIEVFDPSAERARQLAVSGDVVPLQ